MTPNPLFVVSQKHRLILGSMSPRRAELLQGLGLTFDVWDSQADESVPDRILPEDHPAYLSKLKAKALCHTLQPEDILITADTVVIHNGAILNKPDNQQDAIDMLQVLSGSKHQVITAVTITTQEMTTTKVDRALVEVLPLSNQEIRYYIDQHQPWDKAGSYGIQEWFGLTKIKSIQGSYYTIMGLPTHIVYDLLLSILRPRDHTQF